METVCLEEGTVLAFLGGQLAADVRSAVERHMAACSACAELVALAAAADPANPTVIPGRIGRPFIGQLQPGARVGRYQILGALGRGGMGEVYAAYHPDLDRRIALKVVHELGERSGERRTRLLREARAIARLSHPNVVTVHDAGTFGSRVFIAMELIEGRTIDEWLRAEPRSWQQVLNVFIGAGHGLAAAHAAGVIHRDFKPHNVMIGKTGAVRVMDFGLARLDQEDAGAAPEADGVDLAPKTSTVTTTGSLVGTPAYMAPEQRHRQPVDARADQFSFCVALHQALFGSRPAAAIGVDSSPGHQPSYRRCKSVPRWLRAILLRGASTDREQRYRSMDVLIAALERRRDRLRRSVSILVGALAAVLIAGATWRLAHANRIACVVPKERLAAVWAAGDPTDARRETIHRAFAATGRATAETSWERTSKVLDQHMTAWTAMYREICEATHVHGAQSAEVLDLRMSCLNDRLDQVRALTDIFAQADGTVVSRAVTAALDLAPLSRCADVVLLRSVIPPPRDQRTLREVQELRRALAEADALRDIGKFGEALQKASAVRARVEATGYKPLIGEMFHMLGIIQGTVHNREAPAMMEQALLAAESAHDDETAAKAATGLSYLMSVDLGRHEEGARWGQLANAILDRVGDRQLRTRSWVVHNLASVMAAKGDLTEARVLFERALALKEAALGPEHPDLGNTLDDLGWILSELGHPDQALVPLNRSIAIYVNHGDPGNPLLANAYGNRGDSLRKLGRYAEAEQSFERAMEIFNGEAEPTPYQSATLQGLGEVKLAQNQPSAAIPYLERATQIYERFPGIGSVAADAQFALARALWLCGRDRTRAHTLATSALKIYRETKLTDRQHTVEAWLAHPPRLQRGG